jgi:hypothetical protein
MSPHGADSCDTGIATHAAIPEPAASLSICGQTGTAHQGAATDSTATRSASVAIVICEWIRSTRPLPVESNETVRHGKRKTRAIPGATVAEVHARKLRPKGHA